MSLADSHHELMQVVERQKLSSGILGSPYFATLQNSEMSRITFESTQQQFFYAVRFFSRAMAALAARIPDSTTRLPLIHNLAEEHGLAEEEEYAAGIADAMAPGLESSRHFPSAVALKITENADGTRSVPATFEVNQLPLSANQPARDAATHHHPFQPALAHDRTFQNFLERLRDASPATKPEHIERSAVRAFNLALWATCAIEHPSTAFACLGAIEYAFADISALIGNSIVDRGWMSRDTLVHYKLHAEIDKRHAGDFFSVVAEDWAQHAAGRHHVESGLSLGFYLFKRLYDELLAEATDHD